MLFLSSLTLKTKPSSIKQDAEEQRYVLVAVQVDKSPRIDGFSEKEIWEQAPVATHFIQKQPDEGQPDSENTEVRILYNKEDEFVDIPFPIQEDITLPVGTYKDSYWQASLSGNKSRNFWTDVRYHWSGFYGGKGRIFQLMAGLRPLPNFDSEFHFIHSDIGLTPGSIYQLSAESQTKLQFLYPPGFDEPYSVE